MEETLIRRPTCMELFFMDVDDAGMNMTFHYFLQLDRRPSLSMLDGVLRQAVLLHPGVNLKFRKRAWYASDFLPPCATEQVEDPLQRAVQLDYRRHTLALNVLRSGDDRWFLCFDFFHGAVDGRSALQFIYDFFALMDGKEPEASTSERTYEELLFPAGREKKKFRLPFARVCIPKDWKPGRKGIQHTALVQTAGAPGAMAARLSRAVGSRFSGKQTRMVVPVDIRWIRPEGKQFGNLFMPVLPNGAETSLERLHEDIKSRAKDRPLLTATAASVQFYRWIPAFVRKIGLRLVSPLFRTGRRFSFAALVSPVGRVEPERVRCGQFVTEELFATFTSTPFNTFTVVALQFGDHTNTTVTYDNGRVSDLCARQLLRAVDQCITDDVFAKQK